MDFCVKTYGCQMNERDTEAVSALLASSGHESVRREADARLVIVNTCSVRGKAEEKALGKLGLLVASKARSTDRIIGAIGCMAQRLGDRIFEKVPGLDFSVGTHSIHRIPEILDLVVRGYTGIVDVSEGRRGDRDLSAHLRGGSSAFVSILLGCSRRCAYCVVPAVRGPEWSRPGEDIVREIESLAGGGVKEVTLLGQSVMSYGGRDPVWPGDHVSPRGFAEPLPRLLEEVSRVDGIERVRFTSGHPSGCTDELARAMSELPEVCEHLHLPAQSGSDRILEMMRRGYTADGYGRAVERLRARMPEMGLSTDIIVGFPSETAEDFEATRRFMDEMRFDNAFIFKYSPRLGTPAADLEDDVPDDEKMRRNKVLLSDQDRRGLALNSRAIGDAVEVLVQGVSRRNQSRWAGRTRTNKIVVFEPREGLCAGDTVDVRIQRAMAQTLYGNIVRSLSQKDVGRRISRETDDE